MQSIEYAAEGGGLGAGNDQLPSRAEDVDKFMQELAAAASGTKTHTMTERFS